MAVISLYIVVFPELKTPLGGAYYIHLTTEALLIFYTEKILAFCRAFVKRKAAQAG